MAATFADSSNPTARAKKEADTRIYATGLKRLMDKFGDLEGRWLLAAFVFPFGEARFSECGLEHYLTQVFCEFHKENVDYLALSLPEFAKWAVEAKADVDTLKDMLAGTSTSWQAPIYRLMTRRPEGVGYVTLDLVVNEGGVCKEVEMVAAKAACSMAQEASLYRLFDDPSDYIRFARCVAKVLARNYAVGALVLSKMGM